MSDDISLASRPLVVHQLDEYLSPLVGKHYHALLTAQLRHNHHVLNIKNWRYMRNG